MYQFRTKIQSFPLASRLAPSPLLRNHKYATATVSLQKWQPSSKRAHTTTAPHFF